jgi:hypothetical protein
VDSSVLVALVIYRAVVAIIGFGFACLGFRLLSSRPAQQPALGIIASLKQLGSGGSFVLFGATIVAISLVRGLWIDLDRPWGIHGEHNNHTPATGCHDGLLLGFLVGVVSSAIASIIVIAVSKWLEKRELARRFSGLKGSFYITDLAGEVRDESGMVEIDYQGGRLLAVTAHSDSQDWHGEIEMGDVRFRKGSGRYRYTRNNNQPSNDFGIHDIEVVNSDELLVWGQSLSVAEPVPYARKWLRRRLEV